VRSKSQMLVNNVGQHVGTQGKLYGGPFGHNNSKILQQNKEDQQQIKESSQQKNKERS